MNILEFMEEGLLTTVIGMGVVFTILVLLSIFIKFLNTGVDKAQGKKMPENRQKAQCTLKETDEPAQPAVSPANYQEGISPALVAAITASICALTGKTAEEFKFKEIRRVSGIRPIWSMVSTTDIISTRQRFIERGNR